MFQKADNAMQSDVLKGLQIVQYQAPPANRTLPGHATESKAQGIAAMRSCWPVPQPAGHWLEVPCAKKLIAITSWKQGRKHRHVTQILNRHSFSLWVQELCRELINAHLLSTSLFQSLAHCVSVDTSSPPVQDRPAMHLLLSSLSAQGQHLHVFSVTGWHNEILCS